ncbi:DUF1349 domain-containing protein [Deinococcus sp. KNUC1210]|uniref:DUF1349 domain-containing protein n=1 Tax=Deinococcus sp. KNUC1210 TaxID=2917691 RepID=UPI001EF16042|nr:DUF1349 domain-containing protein [Deinococcus sp. KNUC1210]ULH14445.1 DUF1349 domain-containing protein [Deinococcus sp. KNUC1210]
MWTTAPVRVDSSGKTLRVLTAPSTDFWRVTHYGFIRDNGHFLPQTVQGDFLAEIEVRGAYRGQYDQAGLMLRLDETVWLKCGVEYVEGRQHLSAVVTNGHSDWSVTPLASFPASFRLRLQRRGQTVEVQAALSEDGQVFSAFQMLRLAWLPLPDTVQVGPMCASPDGQGFEVTFSGFRVSALE